jgi:predicted nuclease with RNAse H fold
MSMRTLGIDLAAAPARTAGCAITWLDGSARGEVYSPPLDDDELLRLMRRADRVGIDSPLGWPVGFVQAVAAHRDGGAWPGRGATDPVAYRRRLVYRRTDEIIAATGTRPLSVSTDRIGVVALRCALLIDAFEPPTTAPDRSGAGAVAEVYPAAAMRRWGLAAAGYKAERARAAPALAALVDALRSGAPWLELSAEAWEHCRRSDHVFDAVVAALVTRAVALGLTAGPGAEDRAIAAVEGWIHVPTHDLEHLI